MMEKSIYKTEPIRFHGSIPVFSETSEYTEDYEKMAQKRLAFVREHGTLEEDRLQSERATIKLIEKYAKANDMILDIGIGLARILEQFPQLRRYGIDVSPSYLQQAQEKGIEVCNALIEEIPYQNEIFDIVICTDVLEHVIDLNLSVSKALSVLKPGGVLIARTPYLEDLSWYISDDNPYRYAHMRTFDENSLRLMFERIFDCEVIETLFSGYIPYPNRLKYPLAFPRRDYLLGRLFSRLRVSFPSTYEKLLKKWYNPIEINVVVQKKK